MTFIILCTIIYIGAVFCWIRYLYKYSLKKPEDRIAFLKSAARLLLFLPIGLQALLLFCFALAEAISISTTITDFFDKTIFGSAGIRLFDGAAIRIIFSGTLLVAMQYSLMKIKFSHNKYLDNIGLGFIFIVSIFLLKILLANINYLFPFCDFDEPSINYRSEFAWITCILLVITFAMLRGKWIYEQELHSLKYLSLTSRILLGYVFLVFLIALPLIICAIFMHITNH